MHRSRRLLAVILFALTCGVSTAGERCDITYVNTLGEEVMYIRVKFATPYGEPRFDSSRVNLRAEGKYRIGVQGTILPEMIFLDLATKSYVFEDLSGLNPTNDMVLAIAHEEGKPLLRRKDAEGEAEGTERDYLTAANRPNAVDKDFLMDAATLDAVGELIEGQVEDARGRLGELESFDVEAGPVWNQEHALERCPEAAREWSEKNDREARWTGHWRTTVPGEMSVCGCMAGAPDLEETVAFEDAGWGKAAFFPVFWGESYGVGIVEEAGVAKNGVAFALRFRLPADGAAAVLDPILEDLRIDGFRPVRFALAMAETDAAGDVEVRERETDFRREDLDKWDAHDHIMEALTAAYAGTALRGTLAWIEDGAFEAAKAGEEVPEARVVLCFFSKETFEAIFVPEGAQHME